MNHDDLNDLVVTLNTTSNNVVILNQSSGFIVSNENKYNTILRPHGVLLEDLDNDTFLDIVTLFSRDSAPFDSGIRIHFHSDDYGLGGVEIDLDNVLYNMDLPRYFTLGNFNGDDLVDMIVGDQTTGTVVGFVNGNSNGLIWTATTSIPLNNPTAIMLEQLVSGGLKDLVIAEKGTSMLKFWRYSNSTSSFEMYTNKGDQSMISSLAAIDINGDGRIDVTSSSTLYHNITVFNTPISGSYSYSNAITFPTPLNPISVKTADMNSDDLSDLVVISRPSTGYGTVSIYYQNLDTASNANDNQFVSGISADLSTMGDFNGNGNAIATYNQSLSIIRFIREGSPNLAQRYVGLNLSAILSTDLNDDGYDDLIMAAFDTKDVIVMFGAPTFLSGGGTTLNLTSTFSQTLSLTSGDLNDDSLTDLVVGGNGGVNIFNNSGTSAPFSDSQRFTLALPGSSVSSIATGQLAWDNDHMTDIALVNSSASRIEIYYQQGGSTRFIASAHQYMNIMANIRGLAVADLNSDGLDDLLTSTSTMMHLYMQNPSYENGFDQSQPIRTVAIPEGSQYFKLGDLDDDGHCEFAVITRNSTLIAYEYSGSGFSILTRQTVGASPVLLMIGDVDGDIKDDLIAYSVLSHTISFFYQNNFAPTAFWTVEAGEHFEGVAVTFDGSSSFDSVSDQALLTYAWNFGNGQYRSGGLNPYYNYSYPDNGTFTVTLVVTDQSGLNHTYSDQIIIEDVGPKAALSYFGTTLMEGQPVQFNDLSTSYPDTITSWHWDFGDGQISSIQNPQNTYAGNGTYDVELTVTDDDGSMDSATISVTINDSAPISLFQIDTSSPLEKQMVYFSDHSTFTDDITSWFWTFGDGGSSALKDPTHVYENNRTEPYLVTLLVTDSDGSTHSSSRTLIVGDTSPSVTGLFTSDGKSTYNEWDEVRFIVNATATQDVIVRYQWDFQTNGLQMDNTTFNTVAHRYTVSGSYLVTVKVWDADSYSEISFTLLINDPAPSADFTFAPTQNAGEVSFSAALSSDTENDQPILQYRWNFEGTWTSWNTSYEITHTFLNDGQYPVKLEVRDDHNTPVSKTRNVTIDLLPPVITISNPVLKGEVGKPIIIHVNVTDVVGVESVTLEYTIDNVTWTVAMTLEDSGSYFGQIPAQNRSKEISYRIIAEDLAEHVATTDPFVISVEYEDSSLFMLTSALSLICLLALLTYLFLSRPIVDEVFVMYHDGTLLAHQTRRLKPGMDDEILGGMLIALQNFVRDSFKDESSTVLSRMDFGEKKLLVERKDDFFLAVMLSGKRAGSAPQRMQKVLDNIDDNYAGVLREWDGDLEKVRGIRDDTKPIFQRGNPLDRFKRKDGDTDSF
ncbi:MAG TPA: PKD domain-containing protein [Methanomassiliicoccales archaeon]|nr:PKD domain-containing protein [Methanomassiliicoccales archaeon]